MFCCPTGVTQYLHLFVRWICPRLSFFAFKKFFVVSHFIALWFICILLWVFFFCCYSYDSNLFYCEKSHCEHPSFRANLRKRVVKINIAKSTKDLGVERSNTVHTFVNFYLVSTTLTAFAFVFFSIIICFNKHVPHWYLHRQMTYHSDWRHTNTMHCICMSTIWMQRRWRQWSHIFVHPSGQLSWIKILTLLARFSVSESTGVFPFYHLSAVTLHGFVLIVFLLQRSI